VVVVGVVDAAGRAVVLGGGVAVEVGAVDVGVVPMTVPPTAPIASSIKKLTVPAAVSTIS
jgi:hypothetical protein